MKNKSFKLDSKSFRVGFCLLKVFDFSATSQVVDTLQQRAVVFD